MAALREQRVVKAKRLLKRYAGNVHKSMLFSDEKVFTVEQCFNAQNDHMYASSSQQAVTRVPRVQKVSSPSISHGVVGCELKQHNTAPFL